MKLLVLIILSSLVALSCQERKANEIKPTDSTAKPVSSVSMSGIELQKQTDSLLRSNDSLLRIRDSLERVLDGMDKKDNNSSSRLGYVADFMTEMHQYNEIVENEDMFIGKTFTWKAKVQANDDGNMMVTKDGGILMSVEGAYPDGIICAYDLNGKAWNSSSTLPHVKAGDVIAFTGNLAGVKHLQSIDAPFAIFGASAAKKMK